MEYQQIKILLDRYFRGTSTLEEEALLRNYFSGSQVDNRLQEYAPLFQWLVKEQGQGMPPEKAEELIDQLPTTSAKRIFLASGSFQWMARIAAVLVLLVGMWWAYQYQQGPDQTASVDWSKYEITDEKEALEITRGALFKASTTLNQGAKAAAGQMDRMQEIGKLFNGR